MVGAALDAHGPGLGHALDLNYHTLVSPRNLILAIQICSNHILAPVRVESIHNLGKSFKYSHAHVPAVERGGQWVKLMHSGVVEDADTGIAICSCHVR